MTKLNHSFQGFHQQTWSQALYQLENINEDYVIATVLGTSGSIPRGTGTKMVISTEQIYNTLGGGHLELKVIEKARQLLIEGRPKQEVETFHLAANLGQCCGGSVIVMFEAMISQKMHLDIYGAGHVAQALISILAQLPLRIRWIDSRAEVFPQYIPENVTKVVEEDTITQVKLAKPNTASLILTHNHQLDFDLTEGIIKRGDSLWLGVIGSETKAKRFRYRLAHRQLSESQIKAMTCPVGLENVTGKLPMEVAVSISGQIIALYQLATQQVTPSAGAQWRQLKQVLMPSGIANALTTANSEEIK